MKYNQEKSKSVKTGLEDDEICRLLKTVADHFDKEDRMTRERQIRHWRRLKLYWANFSQIYWSETAHDYRIYNRDINASDTDQDYYDKPVNVFKAFLETIIAALSIQIPPVECVPDDADNPLDLATAKAGDKIAELVYKHNDVVFLWLHALYVYCTEGMIACYSYPDEDEDYGTYKKSHFKNEEIEGYACKHCGSRLPDEMFEDDNEDNDTKQEIDTCSECTMFLANEQRCTIHGPDDIIQPQGVCKYFNRGKPGIDGDSPRSEVTKEESEYVDDASQQQNKCPECGSPIDQNQEKIKIKIPKLTGITNEPKTRICLGVYGGLYVKVANYAKKQPDTPYLIFSHETHYSNVLECYKELRGKIAHGGMNQSYGGINDPYEQYGRLNTQYRGEFPDENVTCKMAWLRPAAFNILNDEDYKKLKNRFPHGAKIVQVNDVPAEYCAECLDDYWTLSENPMSDFINHDPLGELLTNIQDVVNDLISLTLQTIEHGIAQTWADPAVVNFPAQRQIEALPGTLSPTKPVPGSKNISEAFHSTQLASLSPETLNFYKIIQELGQFVSGALPSIFGAPQGSGSSRTASEYAMSKGMALQRLQTPWRMMTIWWKTVFAKVIPMYIDYMQEDERVVEKDEQGNFINVFIRKAELDGKIGSIELEAAERMPITDEQQADMIMQLFTLNNVEITQALMDPDNIPYIAKVIKIPEFKLPGNDDREKQYEEIVELVNGAPIPPSPESMQLYQQAASTGHPDAQMPQEQPSVPIDVDVDNHQIEASICKSWLISSAGRLAKQENPNGYRNVLLHMKAHMQEIQKAIQAQMLKSDMLALATNPKKMAGRTSGEANPPKPAQPEKVTTGVQGAKRSPIS